ncbi:MAG TPA: phosphatase PAP2 family protein [Microbacterium sp.]|nr:phosphatase PAP2 family protein [Microbacterium sp.]
MPHARVSLWVGAALLGATVLLTAGILLGVDDGPFPIDRAWQDLLVPVRAPLLLWFSYAMNVIGGGWVAILVVPIGVAVVLVVLGRPWSAAYFVVAAAVSAGMVQVVKHLVGRARPEDILVISDFGSFPSGHVANAATVAMALFVLFPHLWTALAGAAWVVLMAFSRTYLGAHWLTDTIGGALIGAAAALLVAAVFAKPLRAEGLAKVTT